MEQKFTLGITDGLVFCFPLLYTMEIGWHGFIAGPSQFIALMCVAYLLLDYNRHAGMRSDVSFRSVMVDSVEEMGIGLVRSFGELLMLGRVDLPGMGLEEVVEKAAGTLNL